MFIYDSYAGKKRKFKDSGSVNMYYCGPTVYDDIHLGNALSAVRADFIRRYLLANSYDVKFVANWTDIDDKMIDRANLRNISVSDLADEVIPQVESVYDKLNVLAPDIRMFATHSIGQMFEMIKVLLSRDIAYKLEDGIYFDISKFPDYGKLSKQNLDNLVAGKRVDQKLSKRNHQDFVLWKYAKPNEPVYNDPEGIIADGRPGWHIECSAMNRLAFGDQTVDIHLGGVDLKFPHHECEIAQSEACYGHKFVDFWCHNGYLLIDGEKMSKSLNNFKYAKDLFNEFSPLDLRYFMLSTHYRAPLEFTLKSMTAASNARYKLQNFYAHVYKQKSSSDVSDQLLSDIDHARAGFAESMDDDFQISAAMSFVFDLIHKYFALDALSENDISALKEFLTFLDSVLGIFNTDLNIPSKVLELAQQRNDARTAKDYALADKLRMQIWDLGFQVRDNENGYDLY